MPRVALIAVLLLFSTGRATAFPVTGFASAGRLEPYAHLPLGGMCGAGHPASAQRAPKRTAVPRGRSRPWLIPSVRVVRARWAVARSGGAGTGRDGRPGGCE